MEPFFLTQNRCRALGARRGEATPTAVDTEAVAETTSNCPNVHHDGSHGRPRGAHQSVVKPPAGQSINQSAISQSHDWVTPTLQLEQPPLWQRRSSVCICMLDVRMHVRVG